MFFLINIPKTIFVEPRHLDENLDDYLEEKLRAEVEGTCSARYGYILTVISWKKSGPGRLQQGTGQVVFTLIHESLVFRTFRGEVVDCVVESVTNMGFFGTVGPLRLFVNMGMTDFEFNPTLNCFSSASREEIKKNSEVRVKLTGLEFSKDGYFAVATIMDTYLGVMR